MSSTGKGYFGLFIVRLRFHGSAFDTYVVERPDFVSRRVMAPEADPMACGLPLTKVGRAATHHG